MFKYLVQMIGFVRNEEGQGMVEYALIIGGIALIAMVGINLLGPGLDSLFDSITTAITPAA